MNKKIVLSLLSIFIFSAFFVLSLSSSSSLVYAVNDTNGTTGILSVTVNTPAYLFIDSMYFGYINPLAQFNNLAVGSHYLVATPLNNSYSNASTYAYVYANQVTNVTLYMNSTQQVNQTQTNGSIWIYVNPLGIGSYVWVDNVLKGGYQSLVDNLKPGYHIFTGSRVGYYNTTMNVSINVGLNPSLTITLIPINNTNQTTGILWIKSYPNLYANKYIDNNYVGYGDIYLVNVNQGNHITKAIYSGTYDSIKTINVQPNMVNTVTLWTMSKINNSDNYTGALKVNTNIIYADIYIDGIYKTSSTNYYYGGYYYQGVAPVMPGIHQVTIKKQGYSDSNAQVSVISNTLSDVYLNMSITPVYYNCTDTDTLSLPSINYYIKGTATVMRNGVIDRQAIDNCQSNTNLSEYYCQTRNSSQLSLVGYNCPDGCMNGICMRTANCVRGKPCLIPVDNEQILSSPPSSTGKTLGAVILIAAFCLLVLLLIKKKPGKKASRSIRITKKKKRI